MKTTIDLSKESILVRMSVARNTSDQQALSFLAKDKDYQVRKSVAMNYKTNTNILSRLAKDKDWEVRRTVAINNNTPQKTLLDLARDEFDEVRRWASMNGKCHSDNFGEFDGDEDFDEEFEGEEWQL